MGQQIRIHVIPNSNENRITIKNQQIIVRIKSKPVKGKANRELIKFLRKLTKKNVNLVHGNSTKDKIVEIEGLSEQDFKKLLQKG